MSSVEKPRNSPEEPVSIVHRFNSKAEMSKIKGSEIGAGRNTFASILKIDAIELTEPCRSKMCAAPKEAHRLARAA